VAKKQKKASGVVDGFTALKAVREAQAKDPSPGKKKNTTRTDPVKRKRAPRQGLPGASRTALPTKHRIRCYECEYDFTVTGRVTNTGCPKCHTTLEARDHTITEEWRDDLKTIGEIHVREGGTIKGGDVFARDIIVEGGIEDGKVYACGRLELHPAAQVDINTVKARDLVILAGGRFASTRKLTFRNIEVGGELKAKLKADGLVKVLSGGLLRGTLIGSHLEVEEGGGLKAKIEIHGIEADDEKEA
jgi:cytoskeletal protein CcmA (bactofilin family)